MTATQRKNVYSESLRISTVLNTLKQNGIEVQRFNLTSAPLEFVKTEVVIVALPEATPVYEVLRPEGDLKRTQIAANLLLWLGVPIRSRVISC